jgi:RNA polymerase sigma-70 factor (ECF subfamily)
VTERCVAEAARSRPGAETIRAEPRDPGAGPVAVAVAVERAERIRSAVADLPARLRRPVLLHFVEGLSYREIARILGVGLGTVSRRIDRAITILRRALGGEP